jgi:hypothetical protein
VSKLLYSDSSEKAFCLVINKLLTRQRLIGLSLVFLRKFKKRLQFSHLNNMLKFILAVNFSLMISSEPIAEVLPCRDP